MEARKVELAALETLDCGKPVAEAEVSTCGRRASGGAED